MDIDPKEIAPNVPRFFKVLENVPWFQNVGRPHEWDHEVERIFNWDDWAGPEAGYGEWFSRWPAMVRLVLEKTEKDRKKELDDVWGLVEDYVVDRALKTVPKLEPKDDGWYGPVTCAYDAGYLAALVAHHILLKRPIPGMIVEEWLWYSEGHWPCDFAEEPVGIRESLSDFHVKLVVY